MAELTLPEQIRESIDVLPRTALIQYIQDLDEQIRDTTLKQPHQLHLTAVEREYTIYNLQLLLEYASYRLYERSKVTIRITPIKPIYP